LETGVLKVFKRIGFFIFLFAVLILIAPASAEDYKILKPESVKRIQVDPKNPKVVHHGFKSLPSRRNILNREREHPWALPKKTVSAGVVDTLRLLGLRFDFQEEIQDNPNTTGNGKFDMRDTLAFLQEYKHLYDPSPHNRQYFEAHFQALRNYYFHLSGGKLDLTWEVYPTEPDSVYHLPHDMAYYGCMRYDDTIGGPFSGLTDYLNDCIKLVDSSSDSTIFFGDYDSYFLFHAGSDRQNDLGFPETVCDLFTGYIFCRDYDGNQVNGYYVDNDSTGISDALIIPEMGSQDNRAVTLNAVMAHEFGHQLGLIDLYRTDIFFTRVGDFALMDNNGFGTSIEFPDYPDAGGVLGSMPVYPMAWSRAFLGFDSVIVLREGTLVDILAAEVDPMIVPGNKIAKIPISEHEYYLIENRQMDTDGRETYHIADSVTSVFQGPGTFNKELTGEYDFLLPGSGMLIWHVDETVAAMDYDSIFGNNFLDNQLQNDPDHPFIRLVEADGMANFGGDYYTGYGTRYDMYYADNNDAFTPNSNPSSFGYGGTNSHVRVTDISESKLEMTFDLEIEMLSDGFPRRAGIPFSGLAPVVADINNNDTTEILLCSGRNILVIKEDSSDFTPPATSGLIVYDTIYTLYGPVDTNYSHRYPIPLFASTPRIISAGPVIGDFGNIHEDTQFVAVAAGDSLYVYNARDDDQDGRAQLLFAPIALPSGIVWLSFGDTLSALIWDNSAPYMQLYNISYNDTVVSSDSASPRIIEELPEGVSKIGNEFVLLAGDSLETAINLYYISHQDTVKGPYNLDGGYKFGPVVADLNRDGKPEVVVCTPDGDFKVVTIDTSQSDPFSLYKSVSLYDSIYTNPVIADIDEDGYPDIIAGGKNKIIGLDRNLVTLNNFPIPIDRGFPDEHVMSSPVVGDINNDRIKDIVVITSAGNCYALSSDYSLNDQLLYGFPLAAGFPMDPTGIDVSPPLLYKKSSGGGLGFLGNDGWFYSYDVGYDSTRWDWPMGGGNPEATYYFPDSLLKPVVVSSDKLPENEFFCYPNPSRPDGTTRIRFYVGEDAKITLNFYDMSGKRVSEKMEFSWQGGETYDQAWDGSALPTGVYRCILEAKFINGGETLTSFTDIAIIK